MHFVYQFNNDYCDLFEDVMSIVVSYEKIDYSYNNEKEIRRIFLLIWKI